ncbi:MAG: hypothetical protein LUQ52_07750 [Methylococcaceae bacterium]|nr:hypothetical protein [Methylococcaceae bacterium]
MKRNYPIDAISSVLDQDMIKQIVFHEAGHAAAIHLYNKQKQLPPVYFQITIKKSDHSLTNPFARRTVTRDHFVAMVEGGCLIHSLPVALIESANYFSLNEQDSYRTAFEADMINLLVGPLAEAKHVALRDNESFGKNLINVNALHNYGGTSDLEKVYEYLENFISENNLHEEKIAELFDQAFQFIDSPVHWQAIERLAGYILDNTKNTIGCEEAIAVIDERITAV